MIEVRRRRRRLALGMLVMAAGAWLASGAAIGLFGISLRWQAAPRGFLAEPYIQLGDAPGLGDPERAEVLWYAADSDADWWVEVRATPDSAWVRSPRTPYRRVVLPKVEPFRIYRVPIGGLRPGGRHRYRVGRGADALFEAEFRARVPAGTPHRVAIVGDIAAGTSAASRVAYGIGRERPDLLVVTGDVVYSRGRISEYAERFFPVYNAGDASPGRGAPVLRSTLSVAAPGNHDFSGRDLGASPDGLAYFLAWSQPLNGPLGAANAPNTPGLSGPRGRVEAFLAAAGSAFPRMANYSFDSGDVHWTVLDANIGVDWTDRGLREWVEHDIASARPGAWRLVAFHQPGFNTSVAHENEQQMRLLADIFERQGVVIAFCGHVHQYQRTRPMTFRVRPGPGGRMQAPDGRVDGDWTLDCSFDGVQQTVPRGVIYVVSGAGGAPLHDVGLQAHPELWQPFAARVVSAVHSFTMMDVTLDHLDIRQV